ncbi:MAG: PLP-dependent aminotransferase family protein [Vulcanimicrobiota bacterium]
MAKLYERVASEVARRVDVGVYGYGERIPSVRHLSRELEVSTTTVVEAYRLLEDQGLVEARPQSGYYVRHPSFDDHCPRLHCPRPERPVPVTVADMVMTVMRDNYLGGARLADASPAPDLLPVKRLQRSVALAARESACLSRYDTPPGCPELRVQIARLALAAGCQVSPEEIVLTTGCQEALTLCLRAVCEVGDVVAIESPTFYGQLQAIEMLGLRVLEIPSDPLEGISLDALLLALEQMPVRAVMVTPSHSNPTGSCMSVAHRRELVSMLAEWDVPMIEDDVYGDLGFGLKRLPAAKSFDRSGRVLYCSSFSKTLAPGHRLGWAVAGRYQPQVERLKTLTNLASPSLLARGMADFLRGSRYERHLRTVRREYARRVRLMREAVLAEFPAGTRVSNPRGGYVLWVELPRGLDTVALYPKAVEAGVPFAPGPMFSAGKRLKHCLRLTASVWQPEQEQAIARLGRLVSLESHATMKVRAP